MKISFEPGADGRLPGAASFVGYIHNSQPTKEFETNPHSDFIEEALDWRVPTYQIENRKRPITRSNNQIKNQEQPITQIGSKYMGLLLNPKRCHIKSRSYTTF
ncbi:hypothetical protein U1Q18_005167 [Sarracenia purpurea var. burkii]